MEGGEMLATRLKQLRLERNLTVREVAETAGFPISTYRSWEEGAKIVGEGPYLSLSKLYRVSLSFLITGKKEELHLTQESSEELLKELKSIKYSINEIEEIITSI
ncbi:MAG: hypothetical protein CMJ16_05515 [Peredibacter sp.]|nr:hypothetical protein [Peredibacter sp.]